MPSAMITCGEELVSAEQQAEDIYMCKKFRNGKYQLCKEVTVRIVPHFA